MAASQDMASQTHEWLIMAQTTPALAKKTPYYTAWDDPARSEPYRNAATTPYVFPTGCPPHGEVRDMTIYSYPEKDQTWKHVINDLRWVVPREFATCLPMEPIEAHYEWDPAGTLPKPIMSGWSLSRRATYSPGVCPTGWVALNMGIYTYSHGENNRDGHVDGDTVSTATCCKRGDVIGIHAWGWGGPAFDYCAQQNSDSLNHESLDITMTDLARVHYTTIWNGTFTSILKVTDDVWTSTTITGMITRSDVSFSTYTSTHTWTTGSFWYPAWSIIWDNSDTATMSPKPPVLTEGMLIPTWTEGMVLEDGKYFTAGKGPAETTVTEVVPTTEYATITETLATATVVSMHYVQTAGMDEEEMMRSGLLPPKMEDGVKEVENSAKIGGEVAGAANEADGMVVAVRVLIVFLWLSAMAGGAWLFWYKRRRRGSKGGMELEARVGRGARYMEVPRQEDDEIRK